MPTQVAEMNSLGCCWQGLSVVLGKALALSFVRTLAWLQFFLDLAVAVSLMVDGRTGTRKMQRGLRFAY